MQQQRRRLLRQGQRHDQWQHLIQPAAVQAVAAQPPLHAQRSTHLFVGSDRSCLPDVSNLLIRQHIYKQAEGQDSLY